MNKHLEILLEITKYIEGPCTQIENGAIKGIFSDRENIPEAYRLFTAQDGTHWLSWDDGYGFSGLEKVELTLEDVRRAYESI